MMITASKIALLLPLLFICQAAPEARADYYKYKDAGGTVCITNRLESVPLKYRATMKVIREDPRASKGPAVQKEAEAPPPAAAEAPAREAGEKEDAGWFGRLSARYAWFKPLAIVGGILIGFLIVVKLTTLLPSPQLARLLCLAYFFGIFLFVYKTYADYLADSYVSIKQKVVTMFMKANEREGLQPENKPASAASESQANR